MKKALKKFIFWGLFALLLAALGTGIYFVTRGYGLYCRAAEAQPPAQMAAEIQSRASYVTLDELPDLYRDALLAAEDHRFYSHKGIDPIGIARAVLVDVVTLSLREGGSTITQQLAKNLYFPQNNSPERKIAEMFMAVRMERELGKETVLDLYINSIYYGSGYYCIYDAAQGYYGKQPADLNAYEITMLVGVPNAPSVYDPTRNPDLAEARRQKVVDKLVRHGFMTEEEADEIRVAP